MSREQLRVSRSFDGELDETTPLALSPAPSRPVSHSFSSPLSKRDLLNAITNLVNTILGGGMLALPFAIKSCGVVFGPLLLVVFFLLARYTGGLIVTCATLPRAHNGHPSLSDMAAAAFGNAGRVLVDVSLILFSYGALVGYLVIIADVWTPYVNIWMFTCDRKLVMLFWGVLVRISLLRFTSYIALVFIAYLVACIVGWSIAGLMDGVDSSRIVIFSLDVQFLGVLPIIGFAFSFQANVTPVWHDMEDFKNSNGGSTRGIQMAIWISCSICLAVYLLCAVFGYLSFFEKTSDNILVQFPVSLWYFDVGKIGYSFIIMFSYPLLAFPMRAAIDSLINVYWYKDPLKVVSNVRLVIVSAIIFVFSYGLAAIALGISVVFGISGATVGNLIVLGLPCALFIVLDVDPRESALVESSRPWWVYRVFSTRKIFPLFVFLLSLVLTVTGLLSVLSFTLAGGFGQSLSN